MLERILKIHQIKNKVTKIGRRPITKEKSNVLLNRVKPFSSKIIIAANKSFKRENKKVEAIKGDKQKRISNAGKNKKEKKRKKKKIKKEKSNYLLNRDKHFTSKIIIAANKSFKRENKKVEAIKGDTQKRISNAGKNIYVKNGINKTFVKIVIQENSKK